jgi:S1-C subfamily serine protease
MWTRTAPLVACLLVLTPNASIAFERQREIGSQQDYLTYHNTFTLDTSASRLLGIMVSNGRSKLDHRWVDGASIVKILANSPAALAGLRERREIVLMKGAVHRAFYDLIIAVDGERVRDIMDVDDRLRNLQPSTVVYFTIVRDGQRQQIPVFLQGIAR